MAELPASEVVAALRGVMDPAAGRDIVSLGLVNGLEVKGGHVSFALEVAPDAAKRMEPVRLAAEKAVLQLGGVRSVTAVLTAHRQAGGGGGDAAAGRAAARLPEGVGAVIAVASGKGGVGKSTVAVNLAVALARLGLKTGLLDADIYGPSVPRMLGLKGKPSTAGGKRLLPMNAWGLKAISIGSLIDDEQPMIWRGPMVMSALSQLLYEVEWAPLDVLVVDMPPGTGDAQLTLAQRVPMAGAVIVSTPQDVALVDARKGLAMFRKTHVPVFGIVENMSLYVCPQCGHQAHIFGHGGARETAAQLGVDFLGEIPLHITVRETSDAGSPVVAANPSSPLTAAFVSLAARIAEKLSGPPKSRPAIVME